MRKVPGWDEYHYGQALQAAKRSKDPDTQVGCVIVDEDHHIVASGYNGFPPGVEEDVTLWESGTKHERVIHAEMNAIAAAAKKGRAVQGCVMYVTKAPCLCRGCATIIVAAGIKRVVHGPVIWIGDFAKAARLFREAGVKVQSYEIVNPRDDAALDGQ